MSTNDPPRHVSAFLQERIGGIEELEALLLVRTDPMRRWTAASVAASLERPEAWASPALEALCAAQLLEGIGAESARGFVYRPATPMLAALVTTVAKLYADRRAELLRILSDNAFERIRAAAARRFSGAFDGGKQQEEHASARRSAVNKRKHGERSEREDGAGREGGPRLRGRPPSGRAGAEGA